MARLKKSPTAEMVEAVKKIAALKTIDKNLDLGNGVSVAEGAALLADADTGLDEYIQSVAISDAKKNEFEAKNKLVQKFISKVLPAVGLKYGKDSDEYEKVGGVRESERKRPVRKPKS